MLSRHALPSFALIFSLFITLPARAGSQFSDGDFTAYPWASAKIQDTTAGQTAVFSAGEASVGGVGNGACRSNSFSLAYNGTATNQGIIIGNLSSGIVYSPAVSGPINAIASFGIAASATTSGGAPVVSIALLLWQGGVYYTNHFQGIAGFGIPVKESSSQVATAFTRVGSSGPASPDFSTNGGPIEFGYATAVSQSSGASAAITANIGADLFALSISNTPTPGFTSQQQTNGTNLLVTLSGLAPGETITWFVSTNLVNWAIDNPPRSAVGTNGSFIVTNLAYPAAPIWFLRAQVQ